MLEMGTGCGLGTCWILDGMDASASLVSVDTDPRVQSIAASELGDDDRLTLVLQDGGEFLERCDRRFDLIFADAWPGKYTHLETALGLLTSGGIYVVDDMLPQPAWPEGHGVRAAALIAALEQLAGFDVTKLSWSTGLIVAVRRS
jgi:predicted O-methyltransferase YrrM